MNNPLNDAFSNGAVRVSFVGLFTILSLFLLAETINTAANFGRSGSPATDTITVNGSGQATLPPDVARISFTVQSEASVVADAQLAATKQANAAIEFIKKQKIDDKDVKTLSYNISPQYSYPVPCVSGAICPQYDYKPKIVGYQVFQSIQVTVRDLSITGAVLAGLGDLGVQNVSGPNLGLDDSTEGYNAARADAIAKAKTQAMILAEQLNVSLGKIVNFSESSGGRSYSYAGYGMGGDSMMSKAVEAPNIPTGENTYSASVSITYEIR